MLNNSSVEKIKEAKAIKKITNTRTPKKSSSKPRKK